MSETTKAAVAEKPWDRFRCTEVLDPDEGCEMRWWALGVLCLALVMVVAGVSSLNVALPTLVRDLDDVGAKLADARRDPRQAARHVAHFDPEPHQPSRAHQPAHQNRRQQPGTDVAGGCGDA